MGNRTKKWLINQMKAQHVEKEILTDVLEIPPEDLSAETERHLDADDLLRLCVYLHIRPEKIPVN